MPVGRTKFFVGGLLILGAIIYLLVSSTKSSIEYFMTVDELLDRGFETYDQSVRLSGAVVGTTIEYNPESLTLSFMIAHVPGDNNEIDALGGLAQVLHDAVSDPGRSRVTIVYSGVKPDLLVDEAQAIVIGRMGNDGIFYADELLLKCPTKYEESLPEQVEEK